MSKRNRTAPKSDDELREEAAARYADDMVEHMTPEVLKNAAWVHYYESACGDMERLGITHWLEGIGEEVRKALPKPDKPKVVEK